MYYVHYLKTNISIKLKIVKYQIYNYLIGTVSPYGESF